MRCLNTQARFEAKFLLDVNEEDLMSIGMSKNEAHKLKGFHTKYCPPNYVTKLKKLLLQTRTGKDEFLLDDEAYSETVPSPPSTTSGVIMPLPPVMASMEAVVNHQGKFCLFVFV